MMDTVKLIENFCSFQGEGKDSGRRMIFLRFKSCNRNCRWCDTAVRMRITAEASHTLKDIQESIYKNSAGVCITGGEPTVDRHFDECLTLLNDLKYPLANVETNGYRLEDLIKSVILSKPVHYIFSPKIFSDNDYDFAIELVKKFIRNPNVFYKIVYENNIMMSDFLEEVNTILSLDSSTQFLHSQKVWMMPEGTTREDLIKNSGPVFDICEKYNFSFSSRNHIIYGFI